ncbi:MAG: hypothetical protein G01um10147_275 [Microgenomates group bacterium Gr01-1014_7]|nr:MAG: hypothetical protein G01um10147_275 [Microgenomates group bacterium Gr01-1014_7]
METYQPGKLRPEVANPQPASKAEVIATELLTFPRIFRDKIKEWRKPLAVGGAVLTITAVLALGYCNLPKSASKTELAVTQLGPEQEVPYLGLTREQYSDYQNLSPGMVATFDGGVLVNTSNGVTLSVFNNRLSKLSHDPRIGIGAKDDISVVVYFSPFSVFTGEALERSSQIWQDQKDQIRERYDSDQRKTTNRFSTNIISLKDRFITYFIDKDPSLRRSVSDFREPLSELLSLDWAAIMRNQLSAERGQGSASLTKEAQAIVMREIPIQVSAIEPSVFQQLGLD